MRYIVTGGAGFIGSNIALELEKQGHDVIVLDNFLKGNKETLKDFKGKIIEGNESKLDGIEEDIDGVFHEAAITDTTVQDKGEMWDNNIEGFKKVLEFCKKKNAKLVWASSAAPYGDGEVPMKESQDLKPLNVYAESKAEMEKMAKESYKTGTMVGLRYFNVFGPREQFKGKMASMIYQLGKQMRASKRPRVFKFGEQSRDHVYVKDIVDLNLKAMQYDGFLIVNAASGGKTSFNDLIRFLNETLQTDLEPDYFDNPFIGKYQDTTIADMSLAKEKLSFVPQWSVKEGIRDYIGWLNENGWHDE